MVEVVGELQNLQQAASAAVEEVGRLSPPWLAAAVVVAAYPGEGLAAAQEMTRTHNPHPSVAAVAVASRSPLQAAAAVPRTHPCRVPRHHIRCACSSSWVEVVAGEARRPFAAQRRRHLLPWRTSCEG